MPRLRVATRGSELARWQAAHVTSRLEVAHPRLSVEVIIVETTGDRRRDVPVWQLGGQGVFVKEVQAAVLEGRADLAVHSAKDLPSSTGPGLCLAAVPGRADPWDALVGSTMAALPAGGCVGTGSVRRRAQLGWLRPDLTFASLRGNIPTRIVPSPGRDAVVVAVAALQRLRLDHHIAEVLGPEVMLPQVGQGALAVECRAADDEVAGLLAAIDDRRARRAVEAERAFLARLGGGCDLPVGAYATDDGQGTIAMEAMIASLDGRIVLRDRASGPSGEPAGVGAGLADRLLRDAGGASLLDLDLDSGLDSGLGLDSDFGAGLDRAFDGDS